MGIMIREFLGDRFASRDNSPPINIKESSSQYHPSSSGLMVDIEGIHEGPTRNFTWYMPQALKSSIRSWTYPYQKPVIMHHNEQNGETIGRVQRVSYIDKSELSGTAALLVTACVPDKDGIEQIKDGRLMTTSIGVIAHDIRCSCCGSEIVDESGCEEHIRGQVYDGEYAYWEIHSMEAKEISYVVVPSDPFSKNVKIYDSAEKKMNLAESHNIKGGTKKMDEAKVQELQEAIETLNQEIEAKATELQEANAKIEEVTTEKEALQVELTEAKEKIEAVTVELSEAKSELASEVELRESAEQKVMELTESSKEELVSRYKELRTLTGKAELSESVIKARSIDSLKDAIGDLQLELSESAKGAKHPIIPKVEDPTITESKKENVKKESTSSNIDLEESLAELFSGSVKHFNK